MPPPCWVWVCQLPTLPSLRSSPPSVWLALWDTTQCGESLLLCTPHSCLSPTLSQVSCVQCFFYNRLYVKCNPVHSPCLPQTQGRAKQYDLKFIAKIKCHNFIAIHGMMNIFQYISAWSCLCRVCLNLYIHLD